MSRKFLIVCALCVLSMAVQASALTNGNFNTGDLTGWDSWVEDANNSIAVEAVGGYDGSPDLKIVVLATTTSDQTNATQSIDCPAGVTVNIGFDFAMAAVPGAGWAGGGVGVNFYDASWTYLSYGWANVWNTSGSWASFANTWVDSGSWVAPANTAYATIRIAPWAGDGGTLTYNVDNVTFTPEPATMVLLGIGGLLALRRKHA